ncbi:MAG: class I SAM-dependent methyltransferase [Armatimonadota bacterium]
MSLNPIICNLCGNAVTSVLVSKNGHDVYQCGSCGLAFTYPQPQSIADQYDSSYFDLYRRRRQFRLKRADARLRLIELIKEPGRLLDIGCSLGYFVEAANTRGWQASGVEISPFASQEARELGLDVRTGVLDGAGYDDGAFDCVTMWDVLEHVPDPTKHMLEVGRVLSPGGLVAIGTPNLGHVRFKIKREQWRHLKPAEHIFYFNKSSISKLLDKTGFDFVYAPVLGGRSFFGSSGAAIKSGVARLIQLNDVLTVYGVKR